MSLQSRLLPGNQTLGMTSLPPTTTTMLIAYISCSSLVSWTPLMVLALPQLPHHSMHHPSTLRLCLHMHPRGVHYMEQKRPYFEKVETLLKYPVCTTQKLLELCVGHLHRANLALGDALVRPLDFFPSSLQEPRTLNLQKNEHLETNSSLGYVAIQRHKQVTMLTSLRVIHTDELQNATSPDKSTIREPSCSSFADRADPDDEETASVAGRRVGGDNVEYRARVIGLAYSSLK
jgi:hypothetical protein